MAKLSRGERLQVMLTDDELTAIDDWRFGRKMPAGLQRCATDPWLARRTRANASSDCIARRVRRDLPSCEKAIRLSPRIPALRSGI